MIEISKRITDFADVHNIVLDYYIENNIDKNTPFSIGTTVECDLKDLYIIKIHEIGYKGNSFILSSI